MDELRLSKALERQQHEQLHREVKETLQQEQNPKDNRNLLILLVVIVGVFALALGGFKTYNALTGASVVNVDELQKQNLAGDLDKDEGYIYNGYSFIKADGLWWTEMNKFGTLLKVPLHFGPRDVEDITITGTLNPAFNDGEKVYLAINPNVNDKYYTLALSELSFNIVKGMDRVPVGSCTEEHWACDNRTIVDCANNPENKPVVELVLGEETRIDLKDTCIKIQGQGYDLVRAANRILYQWYGVMK